MGLRFAAAPSPSIAPADARSKKVFIVKSGDLPFYSQAVEGFTEAMKAWGETLAIDEKTLPRGGGALAEGFLGMIRAARPDLVLTVGTPATVAVHNLGDVPFVYCVIVDPSSLGLATGGAVMEVPPSVQFNFLRAHFPSFKRVGVIHSSTRNREYLRLLNETKTTGLTPILVVADTPQEVDRAIGDLAGRVDCLLMVSDAQLYSPQVASQIILQTIRSRLPFIAVSPSFVKAGALAAIYPDTREHGADAADVAIRYLGGQSLSEIPPRWSRRSRYAVNLVVAARLNILIRDDTIQGADEVIR